MMITNKKCEDLLSSQVASDNRESKKQFGLLRGQWFVLVKQKKLIDHQMKRIKLKVEKLYGEL